MSGNKKQVRLTRKFHNANLRRRLEETHNSESSKDFQNTIIPCISPGFQKIT